jgi:2-methylcitrate dehydratase PrpD
MGVARELAKRVLAFRYEDLPDEAIFWAKQAITDTIGVTFAGSREPTTLIPKAVPGVAEQDGPCLIFGTSRRTSALDAVLLNGIASHALDFDDVSPTLLGHPSVPLVPPIVALGEMLGANGKDALTAYVAGYETESRIARGVHPEHYEKGWHPTVTLGIFGTVAAAARLLGLDEEQTERALAIAVSLASGVKANFGTMTKPLHVGHSTRNGVFATFMAKQGFTANAEAFERDQGFFKVFNGEGKYDADRIFENWADPLDIVDPGLGIKQFPCCGSTHMAVTMMLNLVKKHGLTPEMVKHIQIYSHPQRLPHTNRPTVSTALEAKFSVHYCVARALMHGKVLIEHFEGDAWADKQAQALLKLAEAGPHPTMTDKPWCAEVIVETKSGETLSEMTEYLMCRGKPNPMSEEEMRVKFEDCASQSLPTDQIPRILEMLGAFETLPDMRTLTKACEAPGSPATAAAE